MVIRFKIILIVLSLITPTILMGHKVTLEDKSLEEIVNNRMALMQKVKSTSSQIFRLLKTNDYEAILELNETLLHTQHRILKITILKAVSTKELVKKYGMIEKLLMN